MKKEKIIFITGPTSSGKSDLSLFIAQKIKGEIINADSRQVYRFLDHGSGKISKKEQKLIPHHLLSIAHPRKNYSLARWLKDCEKAIKKIIKKNKRVIICGGTVLYLKALQEGWTLPKVKPDYKLRKKLEKESLEKLNKLIKKIDPQRAKTIDPKNKRRIIRALEIAYQLKRVPSLIKKPKYELLIITPYDVFTQDPQKQEELFEKIRQRLELRIKPILREIKNLRKIGLSWKRIINFGLEYKWLGSYLLAKEKKESKVSLSFYLENCYLDTVRFAKRQIRELRKIKNLIYVKNYSEALKKIKSFLDQSG